MRSEVAGRNANGIEQSVPGYQTKLFCVRCGITPCMPHTQNFNHIFFDTVDEAIGRTTDHPLTGAGSFAGPSDVEVIAQLLPCFPHPLTDPLGRARVILCDVGLGFDEIS